MPLTSSDARVRSLSPRPSSSQLCKVSLCEGLGYSLAEVQADAGVACAAALESRAATDGAVRVQAQLQVYNPTAFSLHVGSLSAAMSEGASFSGVQPASWGATFDTFTMVRAAPSLPPTTPSRPPRNGTLLRALARHCHAPNPRSSLA